MNKQKNSNINIGIIGIGAMGKGLVYQSKITPRINCLAICDSDIKKCIEVVNWLKMPFKIVNNLAKMNEAISHGFIAICESGMLISQCDMLDVIVEATSSIGNGIEHTISALNNGKHIVLMNSEIDLTFGPALLKIANNNDVICTSCDGDQYGVLKNLIDDIKLWGFELVMAGNIKGYLDRNANPTMIIPEADKRNLDYKMCTSYTDGTKLSIEMAIIANAYDMTVKTPGMYGPTAAHVEDVFNCMDFDQLWDEKPFVDYILGAKPGGGVFVIGFCENKYQMDMLSYYKMGNGPYYLFYRPYHLCHIEAMHTIFKTVHKKQAFLIPSFGIRTNVYAYAKRDLLAGESLDGVGGYTCYGLIEDLKDNQSVPGIPICLAENVILNKSIKKNQKILMSDVHYDNNRADFKLYNDALK